MHQQVKIVHIALLMTFIFGFSSVSKCFGQAQPQKPKTAQSKKAVKKAPVGKITKFPNAAANNAPTNNNVKIDPFENKMGTLTQGVPKEAIFTILNTTSKPLVLKDVKGGCGCTSTDYSKEPIPPGHSTTFKAIYDAASPGDFSKSVKVTTNFDAEPIMVIISGKVVPKAKKSND
jgi:Protein of unknown function (DUF1573)